MGAKSGKVDFDAYASEYNNLLEHSVRASGFPVSYFAERKVKEIRQALDKQGITGSSLRFLNFGCGIGMSEPFIARYFPQADIFSVDVSRESIAVAQANAGHLPNVHFSLFDGHHLPFPDYFDVIMLAGVLHHIQPGERLSILREIRGNLAERGRLFIFEHNPWNPITRLVVRDCPFDAGVELLSSRMTKRLLKEAGFGVAERRYIHFFPKALGIFVGIERFMHRLPLGAQYYIVAGKTQMPFA